MPWSIVDRWPSLFQNILKSNLRKSARMFWQYCQRNIGRELAESGFLISWHFAHQCSADLLLESSWLADVILQLALMFYCIDCNSLVWNFHTIARVETC
jgi:hypothetical protein